MQETRQKELVNGEVWYSPGDDVPNVPTKLFALQNLCTDCKMCEVACSADPLTGRGAEPGLDAD